MGDLGVVEEAGELAAMRERAADVLAWLAPEQTIEVQICRDVLALVADREVLLARIKDLTYQAEGEHV